MRVYLVSGSRKVAHSAEQITEHVIQTAEACNLDELAKKVPYASRESVKAVAKRDCKRCMPPEPKNGEAAT